MSFRKVLAISAAALFGAGALVVGGSAFTASAADCPATTIFQVGGHHDPNAAIFDRTNASLPPGVAFHKVVYPAQISPFPGDTITLDDSVAEGIANLDRAVHDFHAACPGSQITISGFSLGALVAGDALENLSKDNRIPHSQINGVLYADARRIAVNGGPGGIMTNIPTVISGLTMKGSRGFGDIPVQQFCNQNDGICNSENPITNLLGFANGVAGYFMGAHGQYDFNPVIHSGSGNSVTPQQLIINYGPPLPLPIPTPWELFNGRPPIAQQPVSLIRGQVAPLLSPELRDRLDEFPWLFPGAS